MKKNFTLLLLIIVFLSCKKKQENLSPDEKQVQQEQKDLLKSNELLEEEGLRFLIKSTITDPNIIKIHLKLFKGSGTTKSSDTIALFKNEEMNYSIMSEKLPNNTEYTLTIEYIKVLQSASYDLFTEGFTSQYGSKELLISGKSFSPSTTGKCEDIMLIKKGILKFSVYEL